MNAETVMLIVNLLKMVDKMLRDNGITLSSIVSKIDERGGEITEADVAEAAKSAQKAIDELK